MTPIKVFSIFITFVCLIATSVQAQTIAQSTATDKRPHLSFNGMPGFIDMPTAAMLPDGDLAASVSQFGRFTRVSLAFQVTPRLLGAFRYTVTRDFNPTATQPDFFDRSFDLAYQITSEGPVRPALTIGVRDFGGTGLYASEYLVATKTLSPNLQITGGIGWGRYGSAGGFSNPLGALSGRFDRRPPRDLGVTSTGRFRLDRLFRGQAALFGGVIWTPTDKLTFVAEYSSDAYQPEVSRGLLRRTSPINLGLSYKLSKGVDIGAYYLYGSELGLRFNIALNPKDPPNASGTEQAPQPVRVRLGSRPIDWAQDAVARQGIIAAVTRALSVDGLLLESIDLAPHSATVALRNIRYDIRAQAVGRAARALTRSLPASIEVFQIVLVEAGLPISKVTVQRRDIEALEFVPDSAWKSLARARITDAADQGRAPKSLAAPTLSFAVTTYADPSFFDPNEPVLLDAGLRAQAIYEPTPGTTFNMSIRQPVLTNRGSTNRVSNSVLPFVRSEQDDFARGHDPKLELLTFNHYYRPGQNFYGRVTAGYLELAYAGLSAELLWKTTHSRVAYGLELNAVHQRQPRDPFKLGRGVFDNQALTGHASIYYALNNGFHAQLDVGRYLARDWGGTLTLKRVFRNGWEVGGFFTLTNVSFDRFGEGAFDKGIFFTVPLSWGAGRPSRAARTTVLRPILRDGGARVNVAGRLYPLVRPNTNPVLSETWGRFWR